MNQENNNFNQSNYNLYNNNEIPNNQQFVSNQNNDIQPPKIKKKLKWWIPLCFFVGGFLMYICNILAFMIIRLQKGVLLDYQITQYPIILIFRWLALICWLLVIPSLIVVIVKYIKKTPDGKN